MKKRIIIITIFIILVLLGIYLNRSYAHIYAKIESMGLISSEKKHTYTIGKNSKTNIVYVALGDSLTAGVGVNNYKESYPYLFSEYISKDSQIILKPQAIPGAKTQDVIDNLLEPTIKIQPGIITILIGVNDVHSNISKEVFKNNYDLILKRLTQETSAKIYIINIPYIGSESLILPPYNFYFDNNIKDFNEVLKQFALDYKLEYIDIYSPTFQSAKHDEYYSSDLFHPSALGYAMWAKIIYDSFNK